MANKLLQATIILSLISVAFFATGLFTTPTMASGTSGTLTGTWVANGTKDVLRFGVQRETALFKLAGHVSLKDPLGMQKDYWAECIGLADTESGSDARCVWRALNGQEIYILLKSQRLAMGASVSGTIVGGTGVVDGIIGSLSFEWTTMSFQKQNNSTEVGGYATNLKGSFQLP